MKQPKHRTWKAWLVVDVDVNPWEIVAFYSEKPKSTFGMLPVRIVFETDWKALMKNMREAHK